MKIGFYNFDYKNKNYDIEYIDKPEKINNVDILFLYEETEEKFNHTLKNFFNIKPDIKFIPIVNNNNLKLIPRLMALGAITFITEPFRESITRNIKSIHIEKSSSIKDEIKKDNFCGIVAKSKKMFEVFEIIKKVSASDSTVLISGESGTGKELVAKAIYQLSKRNNSLFVPVNCGAIPGELLESELFGFTKGAFTGAQNSKMGRFQVADKGTVFLDEIGEMPLNLQVKILRVLQEKEIQPIGSNKPVKVDIRIIAATNKNLEELVEKKKFREDLYYRLNVIPILLPPLRERKEDINVLAKYFFKKFVKKYDKKEFVEGIADETIFILENYEWPGNVRELENSIERLVVLKDKGYILPSDLPQRFFQGDFEEIEHRNVSEKEYLNSMLKLSDEGINLKEVIENLETNLILQALEKTGGVKDKAAKLLNMKRTTLIEKLKRKNLM